MKFAVFTVVVLALVFNAQSSVIPIGLEGLGPILTVSGPALGQVVVPGGSVAIQASVPQPNLGSVAIQASNILSVPSVVSVAQPAVAVSLPAAVPVVVGAEGTYVAKTRGAVHVAPLPGHSQSAASVNLEPAPGTL